MRIIYHMTKRNIVSIRFLLAVFLVTVLCSCYEIPDLINEHSVTVIKAFITYNHKQLLECGETASAYSIVMSFREMQWLVVLFPVLSSFLCVYEFADEWMSGNYYMSVSRTNKSRYCFYRFISTAITGALIVIVGILVFTWLVYLKFPTLKEYSGDFIFLVEVYGKSDSERILSFLKLLLNMSLQGALSAIISVELMAVLKDRFFALSIPMMMEFLGTKIINLHILYLIDKYGRFETYPSKEMLIDLINPATQLNMDQTFEAIFKLPYWLYFIYVLVLLFGLYFCFKLIIKRRKG